MRKALTLAAVVAAVVVVLVGCEPPATEEEKITIVGRWVADDDSGGSLTFHDDGTFVLFGPESGRIDGTWQYRDDTLTITVSGASGSGDLPVTYLSARRLCFELAGTEGCLVRDE